MTQAFASSARSVSTRFVAAALLLCGLWLAGCEAVAFVAQGLTPNRVRAIYPIQNQPTLVLVDDPSNLLTDPTLAGVIADRISADLQQATAVSEFISPLHVRDLQTQLGSDFARTPVDRIGRTVGARQVMHITVESLRIEESPGVVRPMATVLVKLIDTEQSRRLFPPSASGDVQRGMMPAPSGYPVVVEMFYQQPHDGPGSTSIVLRRLADRVGRDVARVFHDHPGRAVADGFED